MRSGQSNGCDSNNLTSTLNILNNIDYTNNLDNLNNRVFLSLI